MVLRLSSGATLRHRHHVEEEVRKITGGRGVDVILDPIGGKSFTSSYRMLAPLGRLVMFGLSAAATGERRNLWKAFLAWKRSSRFDQLSMINRNRGVFGLNLGHLWDERAQLAPIMQMLVAELSAGRLHPLVARPSRSRRPPTPTASSRAAQTLARSCSYREDGPQAGAGRACHAHLGLYSMRAFSRLG